MNNDILRTLHHVRPGPGDFPQLNFSLDYDGTVTADPRTWSILTKVLRASGHKVHIVTMRFPSENEDLLEMLQTYKIEVDGIYYTSRQAKAPFMAKVGVKIDIWIDDNPRAAHESAMQIWGTSSPEGTVIIEEHGAEGRKFTEKVLHTNKGT